MPVYFFHMTEGDESIPDVDGIEQPDLAAVRKAAIDGARALMAEHIKKGGCGYKGRLDVEDEHGGHVLTLTYACAVEIDLTAARPGPAPAG